MTSGQQQIVHVLSRSFRGDGGEGHFGLDPTDLTTPDNDGTLIRVAGNLYCRMGFEGVHNCQWYGCHPSLSAAANDIAIAACFAAGLHTQIPPGTYQFGTGWTLTSGQWVEGHGSQSVTIQFAAAVTTCVNFGTASGPQLSGCTIDGTHNQSQKALNLNQSAAAYVHDVLCIMFDNVDGVGCDASLSVQPTLDNCAFVYNGTGLLIPHTGDGGYSEKGICSNVAFSGCSREGADLVGAMGWTFANCAFQGCVIGVQLAPQGESQLNKFEGITWFEANTRDIVFDSSGGRIAKYVITDAVLGENSSGFERCSMDLYGVITSIVTVGGLYLEIRGGIQFGWLMALCPQDTLVAASCANIGPIINYGTLVTSYNPQKWWALFLDADHGVSGSGTYTWTGSQGTSSVSASFTGSVGTSFGAGNHNSIIPAVGQKINFTSGVDFTNHTGVNRPWHCVVGFQLSTSHTSGNTLLCEMSDAGDSNFVQFFLAWGGDGKAYPTFRRVIGGVTKSVASTIGLVADGSVYYLTADYSGGDYYGSGPGDSKLRIWDNVHQTAFLAEGDGALAGTITPTKLWLASSNNMDHLSGLGLRWFTFLAKDWGDAAHGLLAWNYQWGGQQCRFFAAMDAQVGSLAGYPLL
jgi:hypothetical protein